jgi:hypothetical protein
VYQKRLLKILASKEMKILPITFYAFDAQKGPQGKFDVLNSTIKKIRKSNGGIIVLHDGRDSQQKLLTQLFTHTNGPYNRQWIPEIVDSLITVLKKENYQFLLLPEALKE